MSYYVNHPFYPPHYLHQHRRQQPPYGYSTPYATPTYPYAADEYQEDFEAEERAALAHLRAIQERKEAAQIAARREAAIRARVAAEREAAIAAAVERERAREEAIRHAIAAERHRQLAREREQHAIEMERRRRAIAAQKEAVRRQLEQQKEELRRKAVCAKQCARQCARPQSCARSQSKDEEPKNDWRDFNDVLGALFGLNFEPQQHSPSQSPAQSPEPVTNGQTEKPAEVPSSVETPKEQHNEAPQTSDKAAEQKESRVPAPTTAAEAKDDKRCEVNLNDLISSFLGFDVTPATASDKATEGAEHLTERLNDFLSQFGLEFEPIKNGESSKTVETPAPEQSPAESTPAPAPQPEVEGKGKGVAEGEKPTKHTAVPTSTPDEEVTETPSPTVALNKLRDISHELHLATESFSFPDHLAFAPTPASDDVVPPLLFNKQNSKYHAQAHKLLQLLLAVDGISSGGDKEVRRQRKALVKAIEGAIESLERKRDEAWQEVKEKRDRGEESDDEGSVGSWATEWTDEHHSIPEDFATPANQTESADNTGEVAEGFEVPASEPVEKANDQDVEMEQPVETPKETESEEVKADDQQPVLKESAETGRATESEVNKTAEKDEGYELL